MKTVKQLANELNVSKATIHRTLHKLNQKRIIETIQDGNRIMIDDSIEKAIIQEINAKSNQRETIQNDSETFANESKSNHCNDSETIFCNDFTTKNDYIELLKAQVDELKADKQYLQDRLTAAEQERAELRAERDKLTAERQTILAELLELRQPKVIEVREPSPTTKTSPAAAPASAPKRKPQPQRHQQPERRGTLQKLLRRFTGRK